MKTIEQFERLAQLAQTMGYEIRYEDLGGVGGGRVEFAGRRCIFIDLALNAVEQLEQIRSALKDDPSLPPVTRMPAPLVSDLGLPYPATSPKV